MTIHKHRIHREERTLAVLCRALLGADSSHTQLRSYDQVNDIGCRDPGISYSTIGADKEMPYDGYVQPGSDQPVGVHAAVASI